MLAVVLAALRPRCGSGARSACRWSGPRTRRRGSRPCRPRCRCVTWREVPGLRRSSSGWMSASASAMPGGQPSTTQPIAGPWLSPNEVTQIELAERVAGHEGRAVVESRSSLAFDCHGDRRSRQAERPRRALTIRQIHEQVKKSVRARPCRAEDAESPGAAAEPLAARRPLRLGTQRAALTRPAQAGSCGGTAAGCAICLPSRM